MSTLLDAVPAIAERGPCSVVMVAGPFMPAAERRMLKQRAHGLPVRVRKMVSDPLKYVAAADAVVAMAGYNTTMEVLRIGTPALLVPRRGPSSEQRMRAQRFADRGWVRQLDPDDLTPASLARAVLATLSGRRGVRPAPPPDLEGSTRAAELLREGARSGRIVVGSARRHSAAAL
jgi:predicted glycosyltransferase